MNRNTRLIAVLTEAGDLNIHAFAGNRIELAMREQQTNEEGEVLEVLLSDYYDLSAIQWQEIKRIHFRL